MIQKRIKEFDKIDKKYLIGMIIGMKAGFQSNQNLLDSIEELIVCRCQK